MVKRLSIIALATTVAGLAFLDAVPAAQAQQAAAQQAQADEQTVTFAVQNMTCALCPITVRKAISTVSGVRSVSVDFAAKTATVKFDPSATSVADIAAASANAGYPAEPAS